MKGGYRQKAQALAKKLGATIDSDGKEVNVEAPAGHTWGNSDLHELVNSPWGLQTKGDVWREAFERMQAGVKPCQNRPNCEWCDGEKMDGDK